MVFGSSVAREAPVLLPPPTSHIIVDPKMDVDLWICGYSLLPDMHSPGRSLPYESPNGFPNVVTRVTQS